MTDIKPGDVLLDNDPREGGRKVYVEKADNFPTGFVYGRSRSRTGTKVRIRRHRVHTDGKPRKSGFSLLGADQ